MKGTKSATKSKLKRTELSKAVKTDGPSTKSALAKEVLKSKLPEPKKSKKTKSGTSWLGNTALTTKSDAVMQGDYEYKKGERANLEKRIRAKDKAAEDKLFKGAELLKSKFKKIKGK